MSIHDAERAPEPFVATHSRRRVLLCAIGGASALVAFPVAGALGAPLSLLHGDEDNDEGDNSDPGGGDHDDEEGDNSGHGGGQNDDDATATVTADLPAGAIEVQIVDDDADGFSPGELTIEAGQSVTFVNLDDDAHTATGSTWDTGIMQPGDAVTVDFDEPGSFPYSCQIHPVMTGVIVVGGSALASPEATPAASPTAASGSTASAVTIRDFTFEPQVIEVSAGTEVSWTNVDQVPHTATSLDGAFDTGTLGQDAVARHQFDTAGRFEYQCAFHPSMTGAVVVT